MVRALLLLAAVLAVAGAAHAYEIYDCDPDFTYNTSSYPVLPNGDFKEVSKKGNWINIAFDNAVKAATWRLKQKHIIPSGCKVWTTRKRYGCYDSVKPGTKGKQLAGLYVFKYRIKYACPKTVRNYSILQNIYTRRDGSFWSPTHGFYW